MKKLLPLLTPSESDTLNPDQKEKLFYCLYSKDKEIVMKAIVALRNVGDRNTLQLLKKSSRKGFLSGANYEISQALDDCIAHLEKHLSTKEIEAQLLRPAPAQSETLLRPSPQQVEEDASTLLRAEIGERKE